MPVSNISRQVRSVLDAGQDALPASELYSLVDEFVLECSSSPDSEQLLFQLDEELQGIHRDVDHSSLFQAEVFLAVLFHLGPVLSLPTIISWFDLVLRPALREPKLPTIAVNHAKELVIMALQQSREEFTDKVGDFRRRLLDFYLLDAFNEGSGDDVLEWAELDEEQRDKRSRWKSNLEDILLRYGSQQPHDLMTEIYIHFATPSSRLQLLTLLNLYTSGPSFDSSASILATHPLMSSLLFSLTLDNSSTVCTTGLTVLVKLLPIFALRAPEALRDMLPQLFAITARILCWRERRRTSDLGSVDDIPDTGLEQELESEAARVLYVRPEVGWDRLELTFNATASPAPELRAFFTALYYLYPCNLIRFLRGPINYLVNTGLESPFTIGWERVIDENVVRRKIESFLRTHVCHPLLVWRDAAAELSGPGFYAKYDVARIASEMTMLDVRNTALGLHEHLAGASSLPEDLLVTPPAAITRDDHDREQIPSLPAHSIELNHGRASISLQDMISTSVALKSNVHVDVIEPITHWPNSLFPSTTASPTKSSAPLPPHTENSEIPSHIAQAVSGLQREVLLLRNELNFELWLSRENVKHIGRLYQERIMTRSAEAERQGLYNKLRKYRAQVVSLEAELREHKEQASSAKNKHVDWSTELQKKLKEFREEKKSWISEAATLRSAEKEARALFAAQKKLLADATKEAFELQTQKKENQHKVDRLKDYEHRIDQHIKMQRVWDADFARFNERGDQIVQMQSGYKQMEMRLESYERTQAEMDDKSRVYRRQIQTLEARLSQMARKKEGSRGQPEHQIAAFAAEKAALMETSRRLKEENIELKDEMEELRAMIEVLKAQHSGRRGLISEPRASPLLYV